MVSVSCSFSALFQRLNLGIDVKFFYIILVLLDFEIFHELLLPKAYGKILQFS